jgi:hypothetical protein
MSNTVETPHGSFGLAGYGPSIWFEKSGAFTIAATSDFSSASVLLNLTSISEDVYWLKINTALTWFTNSIGVGPDMNIALHYDDELEAGIIYTEYLEIYNDCIFSGIGWQTGTLPTNNYSNSFYCTYEYDDVDNYFLLRNPISTTSEANAAIIGSRN